MIRPDHIKDEQAFMRARKLVPGRDTIELVRRNALAICELHNHSEDGCDDCAEADKLIRCADALMFLRQAVRGGKLDTQSGRYSPT